MALYLCGTYVGSELRNVRNKDGREEPRVVIGVSCGLDYYRVFMNQKVNMNDLADYHVGSDIKVLVRPYVGRNNSVGFSDGRIE